MADLPAPALRGLKVLVVEDDADFCDALIELLAYEGAESVAVATAAAALDVLSSFAPDLLLVDLRLGDDDGFDLLERIRAREGARPIPAIAMTASRPSWVGERKRPATFEALVYKPFGIGDLVVVISSLLVRVGEPAGTLPIVVGTVG